MSLYETLDELKGDLEKETLKFDKFGISDIHDNCYEMPVGDRLEAFYLLYNFYLKKVHESTNALRKDLQKQKEAGNETRVQTLERIETFQEETCLMAEKQIEKIQSLIHLYQENKTLPFQLNKSYTITSWDDAFHTDTGEGCGDIQSSKGRVVNNSVFENAYRPFILKSKLKYDMYIQVKVSYGAYKGCIVHVPVECIQKTL